MLPFAIQLAGLMPMGGHSSDAGLQTYVSSLHAIVQLGVYAGICYMMVDGTYHPTLL